MVAKKKKVAKKKVAKKKVAKKKVAKKKVVKKKVVKKKVVKKKVVKKKVATEYDVLRRICLALPSTFERPHKLQFGVKPSREFAAWVVGGNQPGLHLRYANEATLQDERYERCQVHRGNHNFMYVKAFPSDEAELQRLLQQSHEVAKKRGAGRSPASSMENVYPPLRKAIEKAPELRPVDPLQAGKPALKIYGQEGTCALKLTIWSAETIRHLAAPDEAAVLERLFELATAPEDPSWDTLSSAYRKAAEGESLAVRVARLTAGARVAANWGYERRAISRAAEAAALVVEALINAGKAEAARRYIDELHERVLEAEFLAAAVAKGKVDKAPAAEATAEPSQ